MKQNKSQERSFKTYREKLKSLWLIFVIGGIIVSTIIGYTFLHSNFNKAVNTSWGLSLIFGLIGFVGFLIIGDNK